MISEGNYFSKGYWEHLEPNADTELVASRSTGVITLLSKLPCLYRCVYADDPLTF